MVFHRRPPPCKFQSRLKRQVLKLTRRRLKFHEFHEIQKFQPPLVSSKTWNFLEIPGLKLTREWLKFLEFQIGLHEPFMANLPTPEFQKGNIVPPT